MKRTLVIGDVHGCLDELILLLSDCGYKQGDDELILLGDLIDRGPDSPGVITYAQEIGAKCIKGNHEESAIRYMQHEAKKIANPDYINPMRKRSPQREAEWKSIPEKDWKWLESLPCFIRFGNDYVAVHAACRNGLTMEEQDPRELMRLRYIHNVTGKMVPMEDGSQPPDSHYWHEDWSGPEFVIYGHHVYEEPFVSKNGYAMGIDTGCCFGGTLTAAVFEDGDLSHTVAVKAKKEYSSLGSAWITGGK